MGALKEKKKYEEINSQLSQRCVLFELFLNFRGLFLNFRGLSSNLQTCPQAVTHGIEVMKSIIIVQKNQMYQVLWCLGCTTSDNI